VFKQAYTNSLLPIIFLVDTPDKKILFSCHCSSACRRQDCSLPSFQVGGFRICPPWLSTRVSCHHRWCRSSKSCPSGGKGRRTASSGSLPTRSYTLLLAEFAPLQGRWKRSCPTGLNIENKSDLLIPELLNKISTVDVVAVGGGGAPRL